jgi:membrane carboxypeptidase/penicillin-binding protein
MTVDILRNVVRHGTGRRAAQAVVTNGLPVPIGGKTGTTNEYRNAVFMGYVPAFSNGAYRADEGYIVGTYVGYDDNRPLVRGGVRIDGSRGALPVWMGIAQGLNRHEMLGMPEGEVVAEGQVEWSLGHEDTLYVEAVDKKFGLPLDDEMDDQGANILVKRPDLRAEAVFQMLFEQSEFPIRIAPSTRNIPDSDVKKVEEPSSIWEP